MSKNESKEAALGLNDQMLIRRQKMEACANRESIPSAIVLKEVVLVKKLLIISIPWKERPFRLPDALCLFAVTEKFLLWSFLT